MPPKNIPILLTSSVVAYDKGVALKETSERIRLAIQSVEQWLRINPQLPLVLCDGSNFDFTEQVSLKFPQARIECLPFENVQELVKYHGRGYGEGEIVRHALQHSKYIYQAGCFVKCTSKLWVENFDECLEQWSGDLLLKGVFNNAFSPWKSPVLSYIDTRFYIASIDYYTKHFLHAHQAVSAQHGYSLEDCFRDIFLQKHLLGCLMSPPPIISGVGGGTGVYYKNTRLRQQKERWRYALVKRKALFKPWFTEN
jgi:hypothetical protein